MPSRNKCKILKKTTPQFWRAPDTEALNKFPIKYIMLPKNKNCRILDHRWINKKYTGMKVFEGLIVVN